MVLEKVPALMRLRIFEGGHNRNTVTNVRIREGAGYKIMNAAEMANCNAEEPSRKNLLKI